MTEKAEQLLCLIYLWTTQRGHFSGSAWAYFLDGQRCRGEWTDALDFLLLMGYVEVFRYKSSTTYFTYDLGCATSRISASST